MSRKAPPGGARPPGTGKTILLRKVHGRVVASAWPKRQGGPTTFMMACGAQMMQVMSQWNKTCDPIEMRAVLAHIKGTGMMPRDIMNMSYRGLAIEFTDINGNFYTGLPVTQRSIQGQLDTIGDQEGMLLYRDSDTWRAILAGTAGYVLTSGGPSANPSWQPGSGGSGGGGLFGKTINPTTPTQANTGLSTALNIGSVVVSDANDGILFDTPSDGSSNHYRGIYGAAPAAPYTIEALVLPGLLTGNNGFGIGWYDGAAKVEMFQINPNGATYYLNQHLRFATVNAAPLATNLNNVQWGWQRIGDDGTNITYDVSGDGESWTNLYSVAKSAGYLGASGYSNICLGGQFYNFAKLWKLASWRQA
jgi:hypothetical protein